MPQKGHLAQELFDLVLWPIVASMSDEGRWLLRVLAHSTVIESLYAVTVLEGQPRRTMASATLMKVAATSPRSGLAHCASAFSQRASSP